MRRVLVIFLFGVLDAFIIALLYRLSLETSVKGYVLESASNAPLPQATLTWDGETVPLSPTGEFHLLTRRGTHQVSIYAPGYRRWDGQVHISFFSFNPVMRFYLEPRVIRGQVLDKLNGQPVPGAKVLVNGTEVATDSYGRYRLVKMEPPLQLKAYADGYFPWHGTIQPGPGATGEVLIYLEPNVVVGRVLDAIDGFPIAGAVVRTEDWTATTDEDGRFVLRRVTVGEIISAEARYYHSASVSYRGQETVQIYPAPRIILIKVVDALTHHPVQNAVLQVKGQTFPVGYKGQVGLRASLDGNIAHVSAPDYIPVEVPISADELATTIELMPARWTLKLVDGTTGEPVVKALIYTPGGIFQPGNDGTLPLEGIPPGTALLVKAPGYSLARFSLGGSVQVEGAELRPCAPMPCIELALHPFKVKGIYIPFVLLPDPDRVRELIELVDKTELNAIVVDVKSDRGFLAFHSNVPLAKELGVIKEKESRTLQELLKLCKEKGIYTIARMVVFKDHPLATGRPDLAVKRGDGTIWTDREGLGWGNPFREEVWNYNIELAKEVAALGFDEIQFDYIRFPSDGDLSAIVYEEVNTRETRTAAIREFIARMAEALRPFPIFTSADVFGLTVWVVKGEDMGIGQRVEDISPYVDYLCPMVYPSTFALGALGYDNPALYPYEVVYRSTVEAWKRSEALVRPWLQHYSLYGVTYDLERLRVQRQAAEDAEAWGWTYWNAGGVYEEELFGAE